MPSHLERAVLESDCVSRDKILTRLLRTSNQRLCFKLIALVPGFCHPPQTFAAHLCKLHAKAALGSRKRDERQGLRHVVFVRELKTRVEVERVHNAKVQNVPQKLRRTLDCSRCCCCCDRGWSNLTLFNVITLRAKMAARDG